MSKFHGDIRPLSNDPLYMGVVFRGKTALKQARAADDHGLAPLNEAGVVAQMRGLSRDRIALLQHLNLLPS